LKNPQNEWRYYDLVGRCHITPFVEAQDQYKTQKTKYKCKGKIIDWQIEERKIYM
jgi:hypothetical protein